MNSVLPFVLTVLLLILVGACVAPIPTQPEPTPQGTATCDDGVVSGAEQCDSGAKNGIA